MIEIFLHRILTRIVEKKFSVLLNGNRRMEIECFSAPPRRPFATSVMFTANRWRRSRIKFDADCKKHGSDPLDRVTASGLNRSSGNDDRFLNVRRSFKRWRTFPLRPRSLASRNTGDSGNFAVQRSLYATATVRKFSD